MDWGISLSGGIKDVHLEEQKLGYLGGFNETGSLVNHRS